MNSTFDPSELKILLVDDTPANIDVLKRTLKPEGYKLAFSPNGKIALKLASQNVPDLILLDVMMPEMDGFETCEKLKQSAVTKDIPVIFITAKTEPEDILKGFQQGGVDYITKPFKQEELCARVKTQLQLQFSKKQLELQNQALLELNEQKNTFIGMAAHDLRSPLGAICGYSEILLEELATMDNREKEHFLKRIHSSGTSMLNLINDLLDVSVIDSGTFKIKTITCSLKTLIEDNLQIHRIRADKKHIKLHLTTNETSNGLYDPERIGQVLDNLISNAIKYSPISSDVFISLNQFDDYVKIDVKDEGPGLSEEDQAKLFGSFQKLSTKPTAGEKSTGLGLSIVKKIVESHHGAITIESTLGHGSIFSFTLPSNFVSDNHLELT